MSMFADIDSQFSSLSMTSSTSRDRFSSSSSSTPSLLHTPYTMESSRSYTNEQSLLEDTGFGREPMEMNYRPRAPPSRSFRDFDSTRAAAFSAEELWQDANFGNHFPPTRHPVSDRFPDTHDQYYSEHLPPSASNRTFPPHSYLPHQSQPPGRYGASSSHYAAQPPLRAHGSRVGYPQHHHYSRTRADELYHPFVHNAPPSALSSRAQHGYPDHRNSLPFPSTYKVGRNLTHSTRYDAFAHSAIDRHPSTVAAAAAALRSNSNLMAKFLRASQRTLFVRDLPYSCDSNGLEKFCHENLLEYLTTIQIPFNHSERLVESAYVCRNKEGRTQQVGYVLFPSLELCRLALDGLHMKRFLGRDIRIVMFDPRSPAEGSTTGAMHVSFQTVSVDLPMVTEMDLRNICEPFGEIDHVAIRTHKFTSQGLQSGYGFVTFVNPELHRYCIDQVRTMETVRGIRFTFSWPTKLLPGVMGQQSQQPLNMNGVHHRHAMHMDLPFSVPPHASARASAHFHLPSSSPPRDMEFVENVPSTLLNNSLRSGNSTIFSSSDLPDTDEGLSLVDDILRHSGEVADTAGKVPLDGYLLSTAED